MLLGFITVVIMIAIGYAYLREGLFTAFCMCFNVFFSGLIAFNFWEPLADLLEPIFPTYEGTGMPPFFWGYEDALCLMALFCLSLGLLRLLTNSMAPSEVQFDGWLRSGGAAVMGMTTGYLVSGFLVCMMQTMPWHENFMFFEAKHEAGSGLRRVLPPDRVWLALMHRAGLYSFSTEADPTVPEDAPLEQRYDTFDRAGNFELRYGRLRRYGNNGAPHQNLGEFSTAATAEKK